MLSFGEIRAYLNAVLFALGLLGVCVGVFKVLNAGGSPQVLGAQGCLSFVARGSPGVLVQGVPQKSWCTKGFALQRVSKALGAGRSPRRLHVRDSQDAWCSGVPKMPWEGDSPRYLVHEGVQHT